MAKTNCLWGDSIWIDVCMLHESISVYSFPFGGDLLNSYSGVCGIDSQFAETHFFFALFVDRYAVRSWSCDYQG